jgi:hypothetical protein
MIDEPGRLKEIIANDLVATAKGLFLRSEVTAIMIDGCSFPNGLESNVKRGSSTQTIFGLPPRMKNGKAIKPWAAWKILKKKAMMIMAMEENTAKQRMQSSTQRHLDKDAGEINQVTKSDAVKMGCIAHSHCYDSTTGRELTTLSIIFPNRRRNLVAGILQFSHTSTYTIFSKRAGRSGGAAYKPVEFNQGGFLIRTRINTTGGLELEGTSTFDVNINISRPATRGGIWRRYAGGEGPGGGNAVYPRSLARKMDYPRHLTRGIKYTIHTCTTLKGTANQKLRACLRAIP